MPLLIRRAQVEDALDIINVHEASVRGLCTHHYTPEQIEGWVGTRRPEDYREHIENTEFYVAEDNGRIVGYGQMSAGESQIRSIYVSPNRTRSGIGTKLLLELIHNAKDRRLRTLWLNSSLNAVPFYRAHGFHKVRDAVHELRNGTRLKAVEMGIDL